MRSGHLSSSSVIVKFPITPNNSRESSHKWIARFINDVEQNRNHTSQRRIIYVMIRMFLSAQVEFLNI